MEVIEPSIDQRLAEFKSRRSANQSRIPSIAKSGVLKEAFEEQTGLDFPKLGSSSNVSCAMSSDGSFLAIVNSKILISSSKGKIEVKMSGEAILHHFFD